MRANVVPIIAASVLAALLPFGPLAVPAGATQGSEHTTRVSVGPGGAQGNAESLDASVSDDGNVVAFMSSASNLVPGDSNGVRDAFIYDRRTRTTVRVSVSTSGQPTNAPVNDVSISGNGKVVAFQTDASNLVAGDTNNSQDIFVRDLGGPSPVTERVSVSNEEVEGNFWSTEPSISDDGNRVAFQTRATNIARTDDNGDEDVLVRDRSAGTTELVSAAFTDPEDVGDSDSYRPAISGDGRVVAFDSTAGDLVPADSNSTFDVFLRDVDTNQTTRVSVATGGAQADGPSTHASVSGDGNVVGFESNATNLVAGDTNAVQDVLVRDRAAGTTAWVSVATGGAQGDNASGRAAVSSDGDAVAFQTEATNLVTGDTNATTDVALHDRATGVTRRVSARGNGEQAGGRNVEPSIDRDGRVVAFESDATDLVSGDTNAVRDVFVHDDNHAPGVPTLVAPADGHEFLSGEQQTFTINATDPDGDAYTGTVTILGPGAPVTLQTSSAPSGNDSSGAVGPLPAGAYTWTAHATDTHGAEGPESASRAFTVAPPSADCRDGTNVIDGYVDDAYARLKVHTPSAGTTWVCARLDAPGLHEGAKVELRTSGVVMPPVLLPDDDVDACTEVLASGRIHDPATPVPPIIFRIAYEETASEIWVCVTLNDLVAKRFVVAKPTVPGVPTVPTLVRDPAGLGPAPRVPWPVVPSRRCIDAGGVAAEHVNMRVGNDHLWLASWDPAGPQIHVCLRARTGPGDLGGVLTTDTTLSPGVTLVREVSDDLTPCVYPVDVTVGGTPVRIGRGDIGNPISVCVQVGPTGKRVTVGAETGATVLPSVTLIGDPGTPGL